MPVLESPLAPARLWREDSGVKTSHHPPAVALICALLLAGCGPGLPKGVDPDKLNEAVSNAIGDPNTCVLIGRQGSGAVAWRYNTHTTCARRLPACEGQGSQTADELLKAVAADGRPRTTSCGDPNDPSRGVGWAAGPVAGRALVYAAVMDSRLALPGRIMAEKLEAGFKDAGL
jgi:hypothetical protein